MAYQYFKNHKTYPLSLPRRPVGGQVSVPVGYFVEGPYYASMARGNDPLLLEVPEEEVPNTARVETLGEEPMPGERRLLVWSQTRYMERQKGVFESAPVAPPATGKQGNAAPPPVDPQVGGKATDPYGEGEEEGDDDPQGESAGEEETTPKWSKTKLRALGIGEVRNIAAQVAKDHGMSLPEGNPPKETLIEFIVSALAE